MPAIPGSGTPPGIFNIVSSCDTTTGESVVTFLVNKGIAGVDCNVFIELEDGSAIIWNGSIDASKNSKTFRVTGTANGDYKIVADNGEASDFDFFSVSCTPASQQLAIVSATPTKASTAAATDATVIVNLTGAAAAIPNLIETHLGDFVWLAATETTPGVWVANYANLGKGPHTVFARDTARNFAQYTFNVEVVVVRGCTNPAAGNYNEFATEDDGTCILPPVVPKAYFRIPRLNSLRFVEAVDLTTTLPNFDNRLYCQEDWQGITRVPYYQKIARVDVVKTQFRSNYDTHLCEVREMYSDSVVLTPAADLKQQNTGIQVQYPSFLTAHAGDATKSRLYFNGGTLPIAFVNGDRVEVLNAAPASLNGEHLIADVSFDAAEGIPYLVLDIAYPGGGPRINTTAQTQYDLQPFNVYEFTPVWGAIANGYYYIKVTASDSAGVFDDVVCNSEPFALFPEFEGTALVTWRNSDDTKELSFTTGLVCGLRVESEGWQRMGGGIRKTHRDSSGRLIKLSSTSLRKFKYSLFKLPPWLLEKMGWVLDFDTVTVNGIQVQSEEGLSEPDYKNRYALANASIMLEEVMSEDTNGTDLGDINGPNEFISINGNFLRI